MECDQLQALTRGCAQHQALEHAASAGAPEKIISRIAAAERGGRLRHSFGLYENGTGPNCSVGTWRANHAWYGWFRPERYSSESSTLLRSRCGDHGRRHALRALSKRFAAGAVGRCGNKKTRC